MVKIISPVGRIECFTRVMRFTNVSPLGTNNRKIRKLVKLIKHCEAHTASLKISSLTNFGGGGATPPRTTCEYVNPKCKLFEFYAFPPPRKLAKRARLMNESISVTRVTSLFPPALGGGGGGGEQIS